jgi:DNA cross-link repair 1A protein
LLLVIEAADVRFEKWAAEKARRKERGQPAVVTYRDETYVS